MSYVPRRFDKIVHEACSFTTDGYGIFNMRTDLCQYCPHVEYVESAQQLIRRTTKLFLTVVPRHEIEPRVFGFEF